MALDNMAVFNEFFMPNIYEKLAQNVNAFNAASGGAIRLTAAGNIGDYLRESFADSLHSSQRRVDRYAANGAQASTDYTQTEKTMVKIAGGFGPILFEPGQMTWVEKPTGEAIEEVSQMFVEAMMQDMLNTGIAAAVAGIENNAGVTEDVSGGASITQRVINDSQAKFGDASNRLRTTVMTGSMAHKLIDNNLANSAQLFVADNVRVLDILGRLIVITDAPALLSTTPIPDQDKVLSLVEGAIEIRDPGNPIVNIDRTNGKERIETTLQADYDFTIGLKGYSWDETNGGKSPTDAEIATGTNWDKVVTSDKNTAGVIAIGDI